MNVKYESACVFPFLGLYECQTQCDVLTLALLALDSLYQVTLVIVECVDKNNETFANRDSAGQLKGLRRGLTLPQDIESNQEGKWKREWKSTGKETKTETECVTNLFPYQTNTSFWSQKKHNN